jgi:hypothetical protein
MQMLHCQLQLFEEAVVPIAVPGSCLSRMCRPSAFRRSCRLAGRCARCASARAMTRWRHVDSWVVRAWAWRVDLRPSCSRRSACGRACQGQRQQPRCCESDRGWVLGLRLGGQGRCCCASGGRLQDLLSPQGSDTLLSRVWICLLRFRQQVGECNVSSSLTVPHTVGVSLVDAYYNLINQLIST